MRHKCIYPLVGFLFGLLDAGGVFATAAAPTSHESAFIPLAGDDLKIALIDAGAGTLEVSFDGVAGNSYILEVSDTLEPAGSWVYGDSVGPLSSTSTESLSGTSPGNPDRVFGRVRMETAQASYVPAGYAFVWGDHFVGNELDPDKWFLGMRDPVTGDLIPGARGDYLLNPKYEGYVTPEDAYVENGSLVLLNQKRSYTGTSPAGTYQYTSGWVTSMHRGHFNKGYLEVRAKFPIGDKVWPAIWLVAEDLVWGPEWDIWEYFGYRWGETPPDDHMGMHLMTGYEQAGNLWPNQDPQRWDDEWILSFDDLYGAEEWHVYGWEWTDTYAKWWIDGVLVHTLFKSQTRRPADWPNEEMYIILNNGVRGPSPDTNTIWPNRLQVDYIEVYQIP